MLCQLNVINIKKEIFSGLVKNVQISGIQGELGIYPGHSPFLTSIKPGGLYFICKSNRKKLFYISGGILEVQPNIIIILADITIPAKNLNYKVILQEQKNAKENIKKNNFNLKIQTENIKVLSESLAKLRVINMMKLLK